MKTGEVTGKQGETTLTIDKAIADVKPEDFDALFLPGGFSPDILRADDQVVALQNHLWMKANRLWLFVTGHSC